MLGTVLLVIGLASIAHSGEVPEICASPISGPQLIPMNQFHLSVNVYGSFTKNTPYAGKL